MLTKRRDLLHEFRALSKQAGNSVFVSLGSDLSHGGKYRQIGLNLPFLFWCFCYQRPHFRASALRDVGGWDAWNVTEDIDLGFRLARHGYSVGALDSSTFEEAPAQMRAWINQRRRWFKGWMQTFVTHTREPGRLVREAGWMRAGAAMLLISGALIGPMFGPAFGLALLVSAFSGELFAPQGVGGVVTSALWGAVYLGGLTSAIWPALLGLRRRGLLQLAVWLPLLPVYWGLLSIAAWWALYDFIRNPFYWAKTDHGHAKTSWRRDKLQTPARVMQ